MSSRLLKTFQRVLSNLLSHQIQKPKAGLKQNVNKNDPSGPPYLTKNLDRNLDLILGVVRKDPNLTVRHIEINTPAGPLRAAILYIDGMVETDSLGDLVIKPLLNELPRKLRDYRKNVNVIDFIAKRVLTLPEVKKMRSLPKLVSDIMRGSTILILDKYDVALSSSTAAYECRNVEEPTLETVIRGPKEGFTERIRTNMVLLRRKIANPNLCFEELWIGKYSQTRVIVAHVEGVAEKKLVEEVKKRISRIDIDGVMDSGYIEQLIEDAPYSLFPTIGNTEKPDVLAARLLEGRVGVLVDGTPVALSVPRLFYETIQTPEDYYSRYFNSSIVRIIRLIFLAASVALPGFYVAALNFHPEMIPRTLIITIAANREGLPFPLVIEVIFFGLLFEGLREAGVRLPRPVGPAVTIVGALVIGQAVVDAGLVSSSTVIMTAFVAIAGFIAPGLTDIYAISRLVLVLLSSFLGFFGLILGFLFFYTHLCSLRSFGVPYMSPIAPLNLRHWKDVFVRAPLWLLQTRPSFITKENKRRMEQRIKPGPPDAGDEKNG